MPNSVSWLAKQVNNKDVVNQFVPDEFVEPLTGSHPHADIKKPPDGGFSYMARVEGLLGQSCPRPFGAALKRVQIRS